MNLTTDELDRLVEHLERARRSLLPPHPEGVAESFATAFGICLEIDDLLEELEDERLAGCAMRILSAIDVRDINVSLSTAERHRLQAAKLSIEDLREFSTSLDDLTNWIRPAREPVDVAKKDKRPGNALPSSFEKRLAYLALADIDYLAARLLLR